MTRRPPRPHVKILRYALYGLGALVLVLAGGLAYWIATFDARDYHAHIVRLVEERTGRTLQIQGEVALSFWPGASVRLGALTLSERDGASRFASIESARLKLKLRPLLEREFVADELVVSGAEIRLVRLEDGRFNVDDLFAGEGGAPKFEIGRVALERSTLVFDDLASARRYEFSQIELVTGRLANGVATPLALEFGARDRDETFNVTAALKGRFAFDAARRLYALDEAAIEVKGRARELREFVASAGGSVSFDAGARELSASELSMAIAGVARGTRIRAQVKMPKLVFAQSAYAEGLAATLNLQDAAGATNIRLAAQRVTREGEAVAADSVAVDIALRRAKLAIQAAIVTPIEGSLRARTVSLKALEAKFAASGASVPGRKLSGSARGSARVDFANEGAQASLAGKVADSAVKMQLAARGFAAPRYTFAVEVDRLDLDRYTAAPSGRRDSPATALDLSPLAALPATGTLHIGVLKAADVEAKDVRLAIK